MAGAQFMGDHNQAEDVFAATGTEGRARFIFCDLAKRLPTFPS